MRARTTAGAAIVVGLALVLGAAAFFGVLRGSVLGAVERSTESRAEQLVALVEADGPGAVALIEDEIVQVVGEDGSLRAASEEAGRTPLPVDDDPRTLDVDGEPALVVSVELDDGDALLVAAPLEDEQETLNTVAALLAVAVPLLLALVALTTWLVTGRALRPVALIRREVDGITAEHLDRRVPVPATGDEIAALAATMNGMLDRLDDAARAQRRFVSDASHELRSPLATLRQHAELAQLHPETTSAEELAEVVHDEGLRLQGIVDALLLLARLGEGAADAVEAVDVDDIALAEVSRLRTAGCSVDGAGIGAARVRGSARLVGQLLRNLADNASRHARSRIAIGVAERRGQVIITVEDDGEGVPVDERERVFERFVRLDAARSRDAGGSGLGLAIVRGIVDAMDGDVRIDDSRWGGARFVVTLPAHP